MLTGARLLISIVSQAICVQQEVVRTAAGQGVHTQSGVSSPNQPQLF